jgi:lipopolysaccharide/colanic/teichoic acid biosynthesis glycosyltransferase
VNRAVELALLAPALVPAAAVIAICALVVKLDSAGPAFYTQTRVGRGRRQLAIKKLRTMHVGADAAGPHVTATNDRRVTRVGRLLRSTKLDELPQLFAVLRGEMRLVGPRPEAPRYVAAYSADWQRLFDVTPGITDLASLVFRNEEALLALADDRERAYLEIVVPAKVALALEGIERSSTWYDLTILAKTALAVLGVPRGQEHPIVTDVRQRIDRMNHSAERLDSGRALLH